MARDTQPIPPTLEIPAPSDYELRAKALQAAMSHSSGGASADLVVKAAEIYFNFLKAGTRPQS